MLAVHACAQGAMPSLRRCGQAAGPAMHRAWFAKPTLRGTATSSTAFASPRFPKDRHSLRWYDVWRLTKNSRNRAEITHQELLARASLFPRDLLTFDAYSDSTATGSGPAARLLVRNEAIMLTAGHIRAVIRSEELMLFDAGRPIVAEFSRRLESCLATACPVEMAADPLSSFEMRALDLILEELTRVFARRSKLHEPLVESVISHEGLGLEQVSMLAPLLDSLTSFEMEADDLLQVLVGLLSSDEDMCDMLLTEKAELAGERPPVQRHEPVELMLEEYARRLANVVSDTQALKKRVDSASELTRLYLDITRNRMVATNVTLSMVSTSLALVMATAGMFGMNLANGMEESPTAFMVVTMVSSSVGVALLTGCWLHLHGFRGGARHLEVRTRMEASTALRRVFRNVEALQLILAGRPEEENRRSMVTGGAQTLDEPATRDQFLRIELERVTGKRLARKEVDIISKALDLMPTAGDTTRS